MQVIRTSDRLAYKRCRTYWDFQSPLRMNLEPVRTKHYLTFGSALHEALAAYYDPAVPERSLGRAIQGLHGYVERWWAKLPDPQPEDEAERKTHLELGEAMLGHYVAFAPTVDDFDVLWVEREFKVAIPDMPDVLYGFRVDGLVKDSHGRYWILEHKTYDAIPDNTDYLLLDDQCGSYIFGIQQAIGVKCEGVIYNILRKKAPTPLKKLKDGTLSRDKRVDTTETLARKQILKHYGELPEEYDELLDHLRVKGNRFFLRENVRRNPREITSLVEMIRMEASEMLNSPNIYRTPNRFNCNGCPFVSPCIAKYEGSDYHMILDVNYQSRESDGYYRG